MKHTSAYILCALIVLWAQSLLAQTGSDNILKHLGLSGEIQFLSHQSISLGITYRHNIMFDHNSPVQATKKLF